MNPRIHDLKVASTSVPITRLRLVAFLGLLAASPLPAQVQVPDIINYQGRISNSGTNPAGPTLDFKFALVNATGTTTQWSHDGTSANGSEPTGFVTLPVTQGLFSVGLGDTTISGITRGVPSSVFDNRDVHLRIWVRDTNAGPTFQLLSPDQRLGSVGYAMLSAGVINGAISSGKLASSAVIEDRLADGAVSSAKLASNAVITPKILNAAVTEDKLADNAVTSPKIGSNAVTTPKIMNGGVTVPKLGADVLALMASSSSNGTFGTCSNCAQVHVLGTAGCHPAITLDGCASEISVFAQATAREEAELLAGTNGGFLTLRDERGTNTVVAGSAASGGYISVLGGNGAQTVLIDGEDSYGGGFISLSRTNNSLPGISLRAQGFYNSPELTMRGLATSVELRALDTNTSGSYFALSSVRGNVGVDMFGSDGNEQGGKIRLLQDDGFVGVRIAGEGNPGEGGWLGLYRPGAAHNPVIELDATGEPDGLGRINTQVLEITAGSDLSENFDIKSTGQLVEPGMIVCIDPDNPAHLAASSKAYDPTVAGIVSGAGGVRPGMLMGQHGNPINGKHPVALTGRVYCLVDADQGAIRPGDSITTSDTPGHGMKAEDPARSHGAIIGKAMTRLESGKGLVLVLVSLQ